MRRTVPIKVVTTVRTIGVIVALVWMLAVTYQSTRTISTPGQVRTIVQQVNRPTVKESRVRISRSIRRYTRTQLRQLLGRLLKSATPGQLRVIARVIGPPTGKPRTRPSGKPGSSSTPNARPDAHTSPGHATAPSATSVPVTPKPTARPTPVAAVTPVPTQAAVITVSVATAVPPLAGVSLPVPVRVCTVVAINCPSP